MSPFIFVTHFDILRKVIKNSFFQNLYNDIYAYFDLYDYYITLYDICQRIITKNPKKFIEISSECKKMEEKN